jgi:hypothetical protein
MKWIGLWTLLLVVLLTACTFSEAQYPVKRPPPELVSVLEGFTFQRDQALDMIILGSCVHSKSRIEGTIDVKVYRQDSTVFYEALLNGELNSRSVSTRSIVNVYSHGHAHVSARRWITFDGKTFSGQPSEVQAFQQTCVEDIRSFRGGLFGKVATVVARPVVRRNLPESERIVESVIRARVARAFDEESDRLLQLLNQASPLIQRGEKLLHPK